MIMKKNKKLTAANSTETAGKTHELVIANKVSGSLHGGLSRIRLSLTFRIALHYCIQLLRSYIPAALILTVLLCIGISIPVSKTLPEILPAESAEQNIFTGRYISAQLSETIPEQDFFPRVGQQFSVMFKKLFSDDVICFYYTSAGRNWLVSLKINDILHLWIIMLAGIILCDIFRMFYFFRHDQRLNKRVLAPIREIASMAETLSESNLSNRINIAGTKNELKDLATVINRMLDRIERSYNSQKQFVSDASHELRTPISVIRGYTDMLRRWGKDDPEILAEGISAISQETEGMKDLVENLLFLARHDKKTMSIIV